MIRICICDDQKEGLAILQNYGNRFRKNHPELPIQIDCFSASYDLLEAVENLGGYDIYLLDVILPDLNGIEVAHWLRDRGERAEIVFLTTSREYAVEAFEVKAAGYLVKPIEEKDFIRELTDCIGKLTPADDPAILVKTGKLLRKVLVREIVTVESFNHNCVCILSDGTSSGNDSDSGFSAGATGSVPLNLFPPQILSCQFRLCQRPDNIGTVLDRRQAHSHLPADLRTTEGGLSGLHLFHVGVKIASFGKSPLRYSK